MKVIKRCKKIDQDGQFASKAKGFASKETSRLNCKETASFVSKGTPLWPISENEKRNNHSKPIKNVCNTLPSFIHKNSRQGEEWPAKGSIFGFQALDLTFETRSYGDRIYLKSMGGRQRTPVSKLPCCRMLVDSRNPERPHFLFGGVNSMGEGWINSKIYSPHRKP